MLEKGDGFNADEKREIAKYIKDLADEDIKSKQQKSWRTIQREVLNNNHNQLLQIIDIVKKQQQQPKQQRFQKIRVQRRPAI